MIKRNHFYLTLLFISLNINFLLTTKITATDENVLVEKTKIENFWGTGVTVFIICLEKENPLSLVILTYLKKCLQNPLFTAQLKVLYLNEDASEMINYMSSIGIKIEDSEKTQGNLICFKNQNKIFSETIDAALCANNNKLKKKILQLTKQNPTTPTKSMDLQQENTPSLNQQCKENAVKNNSNRSF